MHVRAQFSHAVRGAAVVGAVACAMLATATVSAAPQTRAAKGKRTVVSASLSEYSVKIGRASAPSGRVTFTVRNTGSKVHELVVMRTSASADALPQTAGKVKERGVVKVVDEVEGLRPGKSASLTVRLTPGRYVLICNLVGHYAAGMHAAFRAT